MELILVYVFFTILLFIFLISLVINNYNIVAPQTVFSFGFLFQAAWVVLYYDAWNLDISANTFLLIIVGVLIFSLSCSAVKVCIEKNKRRPCIIDDSDNEVACITIPIMSEIVFAVLIFIFALIHLKFIVDSVGGSMSSIGGISYAIGEFDRLSKFTLETESVRVPSLINNIRAVFIASGYWFSYVIIYNFFLAKKIRVLEVFIVIVSVVISISSGSRTPLLMLLIAIVTYIVMLTHKERSMISYFGLIMKIGFAGLVFISTFITFGTVLGRNITGDSLDYLFVYCGAEVKNLDLFLEEMDSYVKNSIWGSETFVSLVKTVGEKIGFDGYITYNLDLPFRDHNGHGLGNVYTTFYPYIYDFGYAGFVVLTAFIGVSAQFSFEMGEKNRNNPSPSIAMLCYGIICGCLLLSFFSNKFYEIVFTMGFIKNIIFWIFFNVVFTKELSLNKRVYRLMAVPYRHSR